MNNLILRNQDSLIRARKFEYSNISELVINANHKEDNIDIWIDKFISEKIDKPFDNIFIPATIGKINSDFLGLRVALHIRTTAEHPSQPSNIILYSPSTLSEIIKYSKLYKLISTKGIYLIDYSKESIEKKLNTVMALKHSELKEELIELDLRVPADFYDSHSIANFWGAFRLCKVANIKINEISTLKENLEKLKAPYFKWLLAINDLDNIRNEEVEEAERIYKKETTKFKVLGYNTAIKKK